MRVYCVVFVVAMLFLCELIHAGPKSDENLDDEGLLLKLLGQLSETVIKFDAPELVPKPIPKKPEAKEKAAESKPASKPKP